MIRRFQAPALSVAAALVLCSCAAFGGTPVPVPVKAEDKDFVTDAKSAVEQLKADYVFAKGLGALMQRKVDEFLYLEDGLKLGRVDWKKFRTELDGCWKTPVETLTNVEQKAVNAADAARHFQERTALHELKVIQTTGQNAFDRVKACPQSLTDQVSGFPKRASDEAKAWAQGKVSLLNEVRVLVKYEVPDRLTVLGNTAVEAPTTVGKQLIQAETYRKTLEQLGDQAALQSNQRQIETLKGLQQESKTLAETVQQDANSLSTMVTETSGKMATGIQGFGGGKRR